MIYLKPCKECGHEVKIHLTELWREITCCKYHVHDIGLKRLITRWNELMEVKKPCQD